MTDLGIILPTADDAERYVLGAVMADQQCWPQIADLLEESDFAFEKHRRIFAQIAALYDAGAPVTTGSVAMELERTKQREAVGGLSYLIDLAAVGPLANVEHYARVVRDKAILRRTIVAAQALIERCSADSDAPGDLVGNAERVMAALEGASRRQLPCRTVAEVIAAEGGIDAFLRPETRPGIHIPFETIHQTLGGLRRGKLILLGARPAVGKTAWASHVCEHAAANGNRVLLVTLEMGARDVLHRSITGRAQVSAYRFRTGRLSETERFAVGRETNELADLEDRLRFADKSDTTVSAIAALLRSLAARNEAVDLLVIDYLQLLSSVGHAENRVQEVSAIARGLKKITQHFEIPVLALSQLGRKGTVGEEPQLDWLKESGELEQAADQVMFLWLRKEPEEGENMREIRWKCAKNRDGMLNRGTLNFYTKFCRFEERLAGDEAAVA